MFNELKKVVESKGLFLATYRLTEVDDGWVTICKDDLKAVIADFSKYVGVNFDDGHIHFELENWNGCPIRDFDEAHGFVRARFGVSVSQWVSAYDEVVSYVWLEVQDLSDERLLIIV